MGIPQPSFYIFKCEQSSPPGMPKPSCVTAQTQDLFQYLAQSLMKEGIMGTVQPIRTSCMNRCNAGPIILVEPGHTMYVRLTKEKIDRIITEHIIGGNVVEEYVIDSELWDAPITPADMKKQMGR
ncbi:MAG: (2Fe-2S) ferredoxin domain-containing protein [Epsilonproteobacteria bacterium]|nr:(2Fe-2S) ferredoxin domain-containing protein [Campylobacterota bacterium]OIO15381.1 MAG: ferredoxin [Helicobacteraceae bacterium CG1_02_36_14]PIP10296.1 MAG: ferredoxin [Sulfurimonas sp. CG23_combo_of_CG06-09_8_20_14_all_36_33]PIS26385.1 MAG: ferredoxin [Sulfurimonas sp. CG08_land_8_20_14_0_20_36_33]PIU33847.1 MAG: ferredoxin [Sulfurimonas sp. CG07_land_8_20_14_0_80_36_56]PIV03675.1 MAG: ferredoxin [Sulfurimonas sp. CG03_land_8_20_14_0_80_36_25]PIV34182.1 MAG: ferredoxin [Sulfurimonas sp.